MIRKESPTGSQRTDPLQGLTKKVPFRATLRDVTLRDGLQSEKILLSLDDKVALARKILASGFREMEVTAFVHPKKVPPMADAEKFWEAFARDARAACSALVFNRKGLERALNAGVKQIAVIVSASEAHSRRNAGLGISEALQEARAVLDAANSSGIQARVGVASAFGCNLEGHVPVKRVMDVAGALFETGPLEMTLADTSGTGDPAQITERVSACREIFGECRLSLHLHDASGWAFANLLAALQLGVDTFDVTVGGLGGCPFMPDAAGNLPAHRVARFLGALGVETGVRLSELEEARQMLEKLLGRSLVA